MGAPETGSLKTSKANPALEAEISAIEAELDGFFVADGGKKDAAPVPKRPAAALEAEIAAVKAEMEGLFVPGTEAAGAGPDAPRKGRGLLVGTLLVVAAGAIAYYVWSMRTNTVEPPPVVKVPEAAGGPIKEFAAAEPPAAPVIAPPSAPAATPAAPPSRAQPAAVQRPPARAVVPTPAMPERQTPAVLPATTETATAAPARAVVPTVAPAMPERQPPAAVMQPARTPVTHTKAAAAAEPVAPKPAPVIAPANNASVQGTVCSPERAALGFCIDNRTGEGK
jgi:hypothetical protein